MPGDPSLTDDDLQREIDLVGALVLEASQAEGRLSQERIDEILGVSEEEAADGAASGTPDEPSDAAPGTPDGSRAAGDDEPSAG